MAQFPGWHPTLKWDCVGRSTESFGLQWICISASQLHSFCSHVPPHQCHSLCNENASPLALSWVGNNCSWVLSTVELEVTVWHPDYDVNIPNHKPSASLMLEHLGIQWGGRLKQTMKEHFGSITLPWDVQYGLGCDLRNLWMSPAQSAKVIAVKWKI